MCPAQPAMPRRKSARKPSKPREHCVAKFSLVWKPTGDPDEDPIPVLVEVGGQGRVIPLRDEDESTLQVIMNETDEDELDMDMTQPVHIEAGGKGGTNSIMSEILRDLVGTDEIDRVEGEEEEEEEGDEDDDEENNDEDDDM